MSDLHTPLDNAMALRLLERIIRREEAALNELHRCFARRIFAFVFHRLGNHEMAESVVIETLWEVWNSAARFRGGSQVTTWILGIARFKAMEARRQAFPEHEDIDELADVLPSEDEDGEAALSRWQASEILQACIRKLTATHRECMQLVHFEGLALAEVAQLQGVPENTVKTRMFHVRRNLRACIELAMA